MGLDKLQDNQTPVKLPVEKQQQTLDAKTIGELKKRINIFDGSQDAGPELGGTMDIHKGSLFSFTKTISNTRVVTTPTGEHKTETKKQSYKYCDTDGNGTFETLVVETKDAYGNLLNINKYKKI